MNLDKSEIKLIVASFHELLELSLLELDRCPWFAKQGFDDFRQEIANEAEEVLTAKTACKQVEEVGDVFRDALLSLLLALREGKITSVADVLQGTREKIISRKPWLTEDKIVTIEEAEEIWMKMKVIEEESNVKRSFCVDEGRG